MAEAYLHRPIWWICCHPQDFVALKRVWVNSLYSCWLFCWWCCLSFGWIPTFSEQNDSTMIQCSVVQHKLWNTGYCSCVCTLFVERGTTRIQFYGMDSVMTMKAMVMNFQCFSMLPLPGQWIWGGGGVGGNGWSKCTQIEWRWLVGSHLCRLAGRAAGGGELGGFNTF